MWNICESAALVHGKTFIKKAAMIQKQYQIPIASRFSLWQKQCGQRKRFKEGFMIQIRASSPRLLIFSFLSNLFASLLSMLKTKRKRSSCPQFAKQIRYFGHAFFLTNRRLCQTGFKITLNYICQRTNQAVHTVSMIMKTRTYTKYFFNQKKEKQT